MSRLLLSSPRQCSFSANKLPFVVIYSPGLNNQLWPSTWHGSRALVLGPQTPFSLKSYQSLNRWLFEIDYILNTKQLKFSQSITKPHCGTGYCKCSQQAWASCHRQALHGLFNCPLETLLRQLFHPSPTPTHSIQILSNSHSSQQCMPRIYSFPTNTWLG